MDKVRSYMDLMVWQRSMNLGVSIYRLTKKLPQNEQWGLTSQMRRAAISVPSNIAEGYGRQATGEYKHHLSISRGSILELETQMILCGRLGYLSSNEIDPLVDEIQQLSRMLASLISKLR